MTSLLLYALPKLLRKDWGCNSPHPHRHCWQWYFSESPYQISLWKTSKEYNTSTKADTEKDDLVQINLIQTRITQGGLSGGTAHRHSERNYRYPQCQDRQIDAWGSLIGKRCTKLEMLHYFTQGAVTKHYLMGGLVVLYSRHTQFRELSSKLLKHMLPTPHRDPQWKILQGRRQSSSF